MAQLNTRIGRTAPNFLFEYASGREMPLSKLKGQAITLVFWKSSAKASIQAVRDLQSAKGRDKEPPPMLLAVSDGEDPETARAVAAESGFTATVVTDPKREISSAYGVTAWPTIVNVSPSGVVSGIRYGYSSGTQTSTASKGR
jgi:peroxiredoxin